VSSFLRFTLVGVVFRGCSEDSKKPFAILNASKESNVFDKCSSDKSQTLQSFKIFHCAQETVLRSRSIREKVIFRTTIVARPAMAEKHPVRSAITTAKYFGEILLKPL
jgi:hypothetical protein